jgi:hypothetical protein
LPARAEPHYAAAPWPNIAPPHTGHSWASVSDERGCALWRTAGSDLWEVAGLLRAAEHCLVSHAEALKRAPPLPRRPWHHCGVALVTAHAVVSKGGEDDHAH